MIDRILLAVDDSADSLAAARTTLTLAAGLGARVLAVHVLTDHEVDTAIGQVSGPAAPAGRVQAMSSVLARVSAMGRAGEVAVETALLSGPAGSAILDETVRWGADLVVIGRSARLATGEGYVGALTRHVLEFADRPTLVVPAVRVERGDVRRRRDIR
jgi:nucleotide-binding universal stress UspA family protein